MSNGSSAGNEQMPTPARPAYKDGLKQFFTYEHLPPHLQEVSAIFAEAADKMRTLCPNNAERTAGMRHLLEAKDCAVRAVLYKEPTE